MLKLIKKEINSIFQGQAMREGRKHAFAEAYIVANRGVSGHQQLASTQKQNKNKNTFT